MKNKKKKIKKIYRRRTMNDKKEYHLQVVSGTFQVQTSYQSNLSLDELSKELLGELKSGGLCLKGPVDSGIRFVFGPHTSITVFTKEEFEKAQRMSRLAQPGVPGMQIPKMKS